ncbi:MAG: zinc-binding dehydrogenase [Alphaproteobacteria bacterium]|nr:zinc-binding dehydrogenase [Alphaproteobacteria bacterium]
MNNQQIFSTIDKDGLTLALTDVETPTPEGAHVLVEIEACPINPSDMFPLFGPADMMNAKFDGKTLTAPLPADRMAMVASRLGQALPVGNEGAGRVVAAGDDAAAQALMGKRVAILSGATYARYALVPAAACLPHHDKTTAQEAASSFVNPLTSLAMLETMKRDGAKGIVHTAAASNLGQMMVKLCKAESVPLVNVVRKPEQEALLKQLGAEHIVNSTAPDFHEALTAAIDATGATIAFDAIGGGTMAADILTCMERVASKNITGLNTYGSEQHKQVYVYGSLDFGPTTLPRAFGMCWGVGGWLMRTILAALPPARTMELYTKVANEITTTFASHYSAEISLAGLLDPANIAQYLPRQTGTKYLVRPDMKD